MVVTPWGESETLRERMLPPGPGNSAAAVAENQRRRLFGAMVASVAERGYWNTRVADLVELSGVSLRSFYDLFQDKSACFAATVSSLASTTVEVVLSDLGEGGWEEESRRRLATLAELVAAQPAAARLFLIDAYVAGPEAVLVVDETTQRVEGLVRQRLAASERWAEMPSEIGTVAVAAILETFRTRLLKGQTQRLPELADEVAALLLSYKPPAQPLRSAARPPEIRPEEREAGDHAERALRAFEALLTEQPYVETTMEQVAKRAKMSVRTLYANFSGREDLMLAAIDSAGALTVATVLPAFRRHPHPAEGMRAGIGALFGLWASRPNLAHLLLVGVFEGGAPALERRGEALRPLETLLIQAAPHHLVALQRLTAEAILAGVLGLARRRLAAGGAGALAGLTPICTYIVLAPMLGVEQATAAAEGKSYKRAAPSSLAEARRMVSLNPLADRVLIFLSQGPVNVEEVDRALPLSRDEIETEIVGLERAGIVEMVEGEAGEPGAVYTSRWPVLDSGKWNRYERDEREQLSAEIGWVIKEEVEEAVTAGTFDSRLERHLVRLPVWLDEEGWRELSETLDTTMETCLAIQKRVQRRLRETNTESGAPARVLLVSFESPPSDRE
jgi:AcrR family transcriptional regulator